MKDYSFTRVCAKGMIINMPHIVVKLWPGRSEEQKQALAHRVTEAVMETMDASEASVSVAMEEISPAEWPQAVYKPEIHDQWEALYKKPGYGYTDEELGL